MVDEDNEGEERGGGEDDLGRVDTAVLLLDVESKFGILTISSVSNVRASIMCINDVCWWGGKVEIKNQSGCVNTSLAMGNTHFSKSHNFLTAPSRTEFNTPHTPPGSIPRIPRPIPRLRQPTSCRTVPTIAHPSLIRLDDFQRFRTPDVPNDYYAFLRGYSEFGTIGRECG